MLKIVLTVVCAVIAVGVVIYFFFWNRVLGTILSLILKLTLWTQDSAAVYVDVGSAHFSLIAGRIVLRDVRYHSSNQTFRFVKCQLSWRWWIRNVAEEEDLADGTSESLDSSSGGKHAPRCRIHITMEGFEWFMYNRTAAFENILAHLLASNPVLSGMRTKSRESTSYSINNSINRGGMRSRASLYSAGRRVLSAIQLPSFVDKLSSWTGRQLPDLNPRNLLPLSFEVVKGAITMGNHTTESLLLSQFTRAYGTFGIVQSRSTLDDHRQMLRVSFNNAAISSVENPDFWGSNLDVGKSVSECFVHLDPPNSLRPVPLTYANFKKLWARCRKHFPFFKSRGHRYTKEQKRKGKERGPKEEVSHVGADFSKLEYAIDRKLLEASVLNLLYYADVAGHVPQKPVAGRDHVKHALGPESMDIGNGDLPPEWGLEVVVHNGSIHYGPWADRQRVQLQRVFFPQTFQSHEPTAILTPGDLRTCTCFKQIYEFRGVTTLLIPFREASKNWQWDGVVNVPRLRRQREAASIQVRLGDKSTVKYLVPMVATTQGYTAELDVFMDDISVTSSLNDIRLLEASSCSIVSFLPSPLQWNIERSWNFDITLDRSVLFLIRDHINMLIDLGKDWSSGPPHDFNTFVPITYGLNLILNNFELNLYANDHNIIDRPLDKEDNVVFTLKGEVLKNSTFIPSNRFRPLFNEVTFSLLSRETSLSLTLPRWNTHALAASSATSLKHIGQVESFRLDGSYAFHAEVRNDCIDRLKLNIEMPLTSIKLFGWAIRHIMVLRENYFGGFTQYSTTREYLDKRDSGVAVGDPLDLKYRPGKNNVFHFDLSLVIKEGMAVLPAGIAGFERAQAGHSDADIGSCAVLLIPELQVLLRLHDFSMEMTLNTDPITLCIVNSCPDRLIFSRKLVMTERQLSISGLQITANRLFGPQPYTTTYVCIWKIALGGIKGSLDTPEARLLAAAGRTFTHSFTDPFNAPSEDYAIPGAPDATFLNVGIDYCDVSWRSEPAVIRLCLSEGLRFAYNNVAETRHRKLTSLVIPIIELQMLLSHGTTRHWLEAGRIRSGVSFEQLSAPLGWRKDAENQKIFLLTQDSQTHRFTPLYGSTRRNASVNWSNGLYLQSIHVPKVASLSGDTGKRDAGNKHFEARRRTHDDPVASESDDDLFVSEVERDKRLADSRPIKVFTQRENGYDSSPLDESDETDGAGSEDSWSDYFEFGGDRRADVWLPYLAFCRKFQPHRGQSASETQMDSLVAKETPSIQSYLFSDKVSPHSTGKGSTATPGRNRSSLDESDVEGKKYYIACVKDTRIFATALCLLTFKEIVEQPDFDQLSPELRLDQLMFEQTAPPAEPSSTICDVQLRSLDLCFIHEAPDLVKVHPAGGSSSDDIHAFAIAKVSVRDVRLLFGLPSSESSASTGMSRGSRGHGTVCLGQVSGSVGSLYGSVRTPHATNPPSAAIEFAVNDLTAAVAKSQYQFSYSASELALLRPATEVAIAVVHALHTPIKDLLMAQKNRTLVARLRKKQLLCCVLSQNTPMLSKDLLSSVQPAFFVQSGRPQRLRGDSSWKLLFHLRLSLSGLPNEKYDELKQELSSAPIASDVDELLQNRPAPWALDDGSSVRNLEVVESLVRDNVTEVIDPTQRNDNRPPKSAVFRANSLSLTVDNGEAYKSSLTIREIELRADLLTRRMIFEAVSLSSYSSTIRSYQQTSGYVDYGSVTALVALNVESMQVTIFPSFIGFLQNSIHMWRILGASSVASVKDEAKPATVSSSLMNDFLTNRVAACDIRLVLNHMLVEAAAENIVFEVTSKRYSTSCVAHVTKPVNSASLDLSINHTIGFDDFVVKARTRSIEEREMDTLASVTVIGGVSCLLFQNHTAHGSWLRGTTHATNLEISVPKSAIRIYKFMEQWREDYLLGIQAMLKSLFTEIKQAPDHATKQTSPKKRLNIHINASLSAASITLQVMLGTWFSWLAYGVIGYSLDRSDGKGLTRACGLQIASQVIRIMSTSSDRSSPRISKIVLDLPSITSSGSFDNSRSAFLISVGFLDVTIKPSHWDSILSVQEKFGQDFNDLLLILSDQKDKLRRSDSRKSSNGKTAVSFQVTAKFEGFRVGMEGHSFTQFLECVDVDAMISNEDSAYWNVTLTDLALYLSPRALAKHKLAELDRGQLPALISVDLRVVNQISTQDRQRKLMIAITKSHAILQAHLVGDIGDFFDHLQVELMLRKEQRTAELSGFKEKASKVMKTFHLNPRKSVKARQETFLGNASISVSIANFGAVFPLDLERRQTLKSGLDKRITTKALLLSMKSVKFETRRGESGEAFMERFCLQFVSRFDPSNPEDFSAGRHHTLNQMLYPEMTARMRIETVSSARHVFASASISGFILDLDPSITTYIFALVDAYRHGRQRVAQLAVAIPRTVAESGAATIQKVGSKASRTSALTSSIEASLEFMSGTVRMHCTSKDSSTFASISPDWTGNTYQILDSDAEIFRLPALSVSVEYRADVKQLEASSKQGIRSPVVLLRSTVHSSRNALRPLVLSFVSGIVHNVEERMRETSHVVTKSPSTIRRSLSDLTSEERVANNPPVLEPSAPPSLQVFVSLRIDKSRLEFTCRPDVNVIAGVNWESGGFVFNMGPGAQGVSISASIEGLTVGLKHGFLSDDSAHIDARHVFFSVNFSKSRLASGRFVNFTSLAVDTEFTGGFRFSRFQDILCFKAVWLDHIPLFNSDVTEVSISPNRLGAVSSLEQNPKQGFDTAILVRVRRIALEADLGQSISTVTFDLERVLLRMRLTPDSSEVAASFSRVDMQARGNLSGHLRMPDFVFRTVRRRQAGSEKHPLSRMLELNLTSGILDIQLQSDWLWLLQYRAEPLEARIYDDWTTDSASSSVKKRQLHLYSSVSGSKVVAMMTVMAIPKLLMYAGKLRSSLESQREGASRESSAFRSTRLPKPDNALSEVANAMFRSAKSKLKETESLSYVIDQHMKLQLGELVFVILPRSQGDSELARFIGRNVMAQLDRTVEKVHLPAHRVLHLSLSHMSISQLIKQGFDPRLPGQEFDVLTATGRDFPGASNVIFSLPAMDMRMISDEATEGAARLLPYDFESKFARQDGRRGEDIHISFNIRLYSWLTILRKTLTRELKRAQEFSDGKNSNVSLANSVSPRLASPDTAQTPFTYESEGARSPSTSPGASPSPSRHPSRPSSPVHSRSMESVILSTPGKGKSAQHEVSPASPKIGEPTNKPVVQDLSAKMSQEIVYTPRSRNIERLTVKQLGEATPDVMHPFFTKKAGFNLEESLPQYVHEYATLPIEEIMKGLVKLYSKQLG